MERGLDRRRSGPPPRSRFRELIRMSWRGLAGGPVSVLIHTRAPCAGFTGTTWPFTSQSNRCAALRAAARRSGAESSRVDASIQVATCTGWTAAIDGTPALAHQARNSSAARVGPAGVRIANVGREEFE
jgi:hypothetical protein